MHIKNSCKTDVTNYGPKLNRPVGLIGILEVKSRKSTVIEKYNCSTIYHN